MANVTFVDIQLPSAEKKEGHRLAREPIGLLELGAFVRQSGNNVDYVVADSESDVNKILQNDPDAVGFSTYSYNYPFAAGLAHRIRSVSNARIAFGGPHAGMVPEDVLLENPWIDACIADEGELGFIDFLGGQTGAIRKPRIDMKDIPRADRIESLLDNSNFRLLDYENHRTAVVMASRGCTRSCDFCTSRLTGYRAKPLDSVIGELESLVSDYGVEVVIFEDPLLNGDLRYLEALCDRIAAEYLPLYMIGVCDFNFGRRPADILKKMARAGFMQINWGVEDPRQEYRTALNKKIRLQDDVLRVARSSGIYNRGLLMLPTNLEAADPVEDVRSYAESLAHLALDEVKVNVTTPFPGTPLYDRLDSAGKITERDWSKYDTHNLVFQAGRWTQEVVDWGRKYIVEDFSPSQMNI
ncbi:MAG: cobalamin B12-binding domain-containing protein [Candidatus Aenigmarchaeota archaeon]|nr:cobalamin B12-binding domain-containing protein [Candidatus Aenigmarchaeota archaeon]